ncbi:MAG: YceI family protein [Bacteroidota bacterium]
MKKLFLSVFALSLLFSAGINAQVYTIDDSHSAVLMKVKRFGLVNVVGRFGDVAGTITYDSDDLEATDLNISVSVDSYTANNPGGENSARGSAFLDAANHPTLRFQLIKTSVKDDVLNLTGNITIRGVTREVEFPVRILGPAMDLPTRKQSIALNGVIQINRLDFGVGPDRTLQDGREIIGNKVEILLEILAISE